MPMKVYIFAKISCDNKNALQQLHTLIALTGFCKNKSVRFCKISLVPPGLILPVRLYGYLCSFFTNKLFIAIFPFSNFHGNFSLLYKRLKFSKYYFFLLKQPTHLKIHSISLSWIEKKYLFFNLYSCLYLHVLRGLYFFQIILICKFLWKNKFYFWHTLLFRIKKNMYAFPRKNSLTKLCQKKIIWKNSLWHV